jgi:hypothetical protein
MKNHIKTLALLSAVAFAASLQAGVTETDGLGTSWIGTPNFATYANPTPLNNPNGAFSAEGNYGTGGSGTFGGLAQGFYLTAGGTLDNIQLSLAGAANTFNVFLYDFGPFSSYVQGTGATVNPVSNGGSAANLFTPGLQFVYNGGAGGALNIAKLQFSGGDAVSLLANEYYVLAIEPTTAAASQWSRGGGSTTGLYGQGYRLNQFTAAPGQYGAINGGVREFGLAVTVPEPSAIALLGLGLAGLLIRRKA